MARKNPRRNISRIAPADRDGKSSGWLVRMQRKYEKVNRFFADAAWGGNRAALQAAKEFRDELEAESEKLTTEERSESPSTRNKSGVVGVRLHRQKDVRGKYEYQYWYWVAQWIDGRGRRRTRSFSIHTHGDDKAYRMACKARREGVASAHR